MPPRNTTYNVDYRMRGDASGLEGAVGRARAATNRLAGSMFDVGQSGANAFRQIAGGFTALLVADRLFGAIGSMVAPSRELGEAMAELRSIATYTSDEFERLEGAAIAAAAATIFTPKEAIEGLRDLARVGVSAEGALNGILPVLAVAQASFGKLGVAGAAELAARLLQAFNIHADRLSGVMGSVLAATKRSLLPIQEVSAGLGRLAGAAAQSGTSVEDSLVMLAILRNVLPRTSLAASELSNAMLSLTDPKIGGELHKMFGVSVAGADKRLRPVLDIMLDLAAASAKTASGGVKIREIFGATAAKAILPLLSQLQNGFNVAGVGFVQGQAAVNAFRQAVAQGGEELKKSLEERARSSAFQMERLSEAVRGVHGLLGKPVETALATVLEKIGNFAGWVSGLLGDKGPLGAALRFFGSNMLTTVVVAGAALASVLGLVGGFAILIAALRFVRTNMVGWLESAAAATAGVGTLSGAVTRAGPPMLGILSTFRMFPTILKGMMVGLVGLLKPLGILFLAIGAIQLIWRGVSALMGSAPSTGAELARLQGQGAVALARGGQIGGEALKEGAEAVAGAGPVLEKATEKLLDLYKGKGPALNLNVLDKLFGAIQRTVAHPPAGLPAKTFEFLSEQSTTLRRAFAKLAGGVELSDDEFREAQLSLGELSAVIKSGQIKPLTKFGKGMDEIGEALEHMLTPQARFARQALAKAGFGPMFPAAAPEVGAPAAAARAAPPAGSREAQRAAYKRDLAEATVQFLRPQLFVTSTEARAEARRRRSLAGAEFNQEGFVESMQSLRALMTDFLDWATGVQTAKNEIRDFAANLREVNDEMGGTGRAFAR